MIPRPAHICAGALALCSFEGPRREPARRRAGRPGLHRFPVAMARGKHLFPFRTEPLSPSAPMVLGSQGPGRVGRRRFLQASRPAVRPRGERLDALKRALVGARRDPSRRRPGAIRPGGHPRKPPRGRVTGGAGKSEPRQQPGGADSRACGRPERTPWACSRAERTPWACGRLAVLSKRGRTSLAGRRPNGRDAVRRTWQDSARTAAGSAGQRAPVRVPAVKVDGPRGLGQICPEDVLGGGAPPGAQAAYG